MNIFTQNICHVTLQRTEEPPIFPSFHSQVLLRSQHLYQCLSCRVPHLHTSMDLCHTDILIRDVVYTYSVIKYISCTVRSVGVSYLIKQPYKILQLLIYKAKFQATRLRELGIQFSPASSSTNICKNKFPFLRVHDFYQPFFFTKQIQYSKLENLERSIKRL